MGKITTALAAWALSIQKRAELSVAQAELGITVLEAVNVDRFNCELKALTGSDEQAEPIREFALDVAKSGIRPIELYPCLQGQPHVSRPNLTDMTDFALKAWQSKLDRECDATVAEMRTRLASSFPQCDPACTADCGRCKGGLVPGSPAAAKAKQGSKMTREELDALPIGSVVMTMTDPVTFGVYEQRVWQKYGGAREWQFGRPAHDWQSTDGGFVETGHMQVPFAWSFAFNRRVLVLFTPDEATTRSIIEAHSTAQQQRSQSGPTVFADGE